MVHSPLQIMSTIQPSSPCKMPSNNDYGLHSQYYSPHTHPHHHHSHHQGLVGNENNSKFGSNILSIATSGILEGNLFSSKDNGNGGNHLPALENGSLSDKLIPHYGGPSTDFLTQPYTTNHQSSSWYQPPRSPHFHNQMNNMSNGNNTPFTDSWAAAAASMVNVLPHCNYSLSSSPVYGHSVSTHRHQTQSTQYGERNPYQYQYNVGGYMPNIEPINPTASELDLNRGNPNSVAVVNSGGGGDVSICEEKPQMSSGEDIDKSDDETLNCGTSATFGNSNRPQPARSPYEWIKKSSYQSQNQTNGKTRTRDKYRVVYSDHQRLELEKEFHYSRYITIRRKADLASMLGLSERQVKIWFQNRRAKERKQQKKREEITKGTKDTSGQISSHHVLLGSYNPSIDGQVPIPLPTGNGTY